MLTSSVFIFRTLKYRNKWLKIIPHHAELLALAHHAHVMLGVGDPVLVGWGSVWRLEFGRGEMFFSSIPLLVRVVWWCVRGSAAWKHKEETVWNRSFISFRGTLLFRQDYQCAPGCTHLQKVSGNPFAPTTARRSPGQDTSSELLKGWLQSLKHIS